MKRIVLLIAFLITAAAVAGQQSADKPVEQTKVNIRVLNGLPTSQLIPVMAFMSNSLGVACTHCHVDKDWQSEEKPQKTVARQHITLTRTLNEQFFGRQNTITCNTCHNGQARPAATPLVANAGWNRTAPAAVALPPAEEILKRYVAAIGGEAAFNAKNRLSSGDVTRSSGREPAVTKPFRLFQTAASAKIDTELPYPPEGNRMATSFYVAAPQLQRAYTSLTTVGRESVRGRDAWVVEAAPREGPVERLYFDAATALLLRRWKATVTPFGLLPEEYDFDDWRTSGAAKLPFRMEWSRADYRVTHQVEETETNVEPAPRP